MKLGIIPNSMDFSHPQDRRRYVKYIVEKGVNFEIAHFGSFYDVLYSLNWIKFMNNTESVDRDHKTR